MKVKKIIPDPQRIRRGLTRWYDDHRRPLPWRETRDPYAIWISEIMLQQTRVETVVPYYRRFIERFPTVESLARAPLGDVLKTWENLGYYARVRNLHKAAGEIAARFGGRIPERLEEIIRLPGIGRYTAGAILSIAFGRAVPAVDGNVRRVISRLHAIEESVDDEEVRERIEELVRTLVPTRDPGRFNQALMELGAVCCTPKSPACPACPLQNDCRARLQGLAHRLPVRGKKKTIPHREVVAAVIRDGEGRILIVQRPSRGLLGSLWKFPGGILNPPEGREEGLMRIVRDELGLGIGVGSPLAAVKHAYTHFRITLTAFSCTLREGSPAGPPWRWAGGDEIEGLPFSKADRRIACSVTPAG
ncbi:MAG: A/G-specific adenine glycosylase [Deltaproteobacteria bacterium]|nr:A/G-specific adenine glycosylase [Deltaproteobacteria bacterium]